MRFFLIIFFIFIDICLFTEERNTASDNRVNDILQYGIDSEVSALLKELSAFPSSDIYNKIEERYKGLKSPILKIDFINYIAKTRNPPQSMIDLVYEDATKENADRGLITTAIIAFSKIGSKREGDFVLEKLDSSDNIIKSSAADAISQMKRDGFGNQLLERLDDESSDKEPLSDDIKTRLIIFLGENKIEKAIPYLKNIISNKNNNRFMIINGMIALLKMGDLSALPQIEENLNSSDVRIQEYAAYTIGSYENSAVIPILHGMLMNNNENVRINGLKGITLNRDITSIDIVVYKLKNDPSQKVREEAFTTLLCLGSKGIEKIKEIYHGKKFSHSNLTIMSRSVAMKPDSENVQFLLDIYGSADKREREIIAKNIVAAKSNLVDPIISLILESDDYLIRLGGLKAVYNIENSSLWGKVENIANNDKMETVRRNAKRYLEMNEKSDG